MLINDFPQNTTNIMCRFTYDGILRWAKLCELDKSN